MRHNNLTDEGVIRIGKIFKTNTVLNSLDLSENSGITDRFPVKVYKTLKKENTTLKSLSLEGTRVSKASIEKITKAINIDPVWKKPNSLRGEDPRRRDGRENDRYNDSDNDNNNDSDSDSDSDDDDFEYEPFAKHHCAPVPSKPQPQPAPTKTPFMLAKEPLKPKTKVADSVFVVDGPKHKTSHMQWKSVEDLCTWAMDMFPKCSDVLCAAFRKNGVTWDTLCGETREDFLRYGLSKEDANDFYECVKGEKLFLLPDEGDEYMSIVEVVHELGYDEYKLDGSINEVFKRSRDVRAEYNLSIGDVIVIALYTLNNGGDGQPVYSIINRKTSMRRSNRVYRWYIYHLLFALRKLPTYQNVGVLYRGVPREINVEEKYKIGMSRKWLPFTSTTREVGVANSFLVNSEYPNLFEIRGPVKGYDISKFSHFGGENEVLLEPYFSFKTTSVTDYHFRPDTKGKKICVQSVYREEYFVPDESIKGIALLEPMPQGWRVDVDGDGRIIYISKDATTHISPNYTSYDVFKTELKSLTCGTKCDIMEVD